MKPANYYLSEIISQTSSNNTQVHAFASKYKQEIFLIVALKVSLEAFWKTKMW